MAKKLGITQQAYSRKERGERKFFVDEGFILEETLNVPLRELFKELD
ncbi:XRE family transcriptional regulator [Paraclostridium bifermentans]|nr:XRE family transcriptional regulator [Paraclostridium bifermentans]